MNSKNGKKGPLLILLGSLAAFGSLSIDMYLPAFPEIALEFSTSLERVQLSLASFFFGISLGQIVYGPLSDRFGRRKPLILGLLIYMVASLICAFSRSIESLVVGRFLQAVGACGGIVISRAIVRDIYGSQESARIFSLLMLVMGVAPILAPLVGGYVATEAGWRSIFLVLFSIGAICLLVTLRILFESKEEDPRVRMRKVIPNYWELCKQREFMGFALSGGVAYATMFAYITGAPFLFIHHFGIPPQYFGWIFGMNACALIGFSQWNAVLLRTKSLRLVLKFALLSSVVIGVLLWITARQNSGMFWILPVLFLYIGNLGMVYPNAIAGALENQRTHAGSASALFGTIQFTAASVFSFLVSSFPNHTLLAVTSTMAGGSLLACIVAFCFGVLERN